MELRLLLRSGESLLVTFAVPLGVLVLFGTTDLLPTSSGAVGKPSDPLDFLVPGVLAVAILSTGFVAQAIQTGFERKYYVLKRLGASPLTRQQFLGAKATSVAVVVAAQVVVLLGVAVALGWRVGGSSAGQQEVLWLLPVGVVLGAAVFTVLGLALAGAMRAELVLAGSNAVYLVLVALSDLVFDLPDSLAPVVVLTPSGALGIVLRRALEGPTAAPVAVALLVLVAWGLAGLAVAVRTFRWEP